MSRKIGACDVCLGSKQQFPRHNFRNIHRPTHAFLIGFSSVLDQKGHRQRFAHFITVWVFENLQTVSAKSCHAAKPDKRSSLYRSWAIPCGGATVYAPRHRAERLAKITETREIGFREVGRLEAVGQQFGSYIDVALWQGRASSGPLKSSASSQRTVSPTEIRLNDS
jgi:hypothetical protein